MGNHFLFASICLFASIFTKKYFLFKSNRQAELEILKGDVSELNRRCEDQKKWVIIIIITITIIIVIHPNSIEKKTKELGITIFESTFHMWHQHNQHQHRYQNHHIIIIIVTAMTMMMMMKMTMMMMMMMLMMMMMQ